MAAAMSKVVEHSPPGVPPPPHPVLNHSTRLRYSADGSCSLPERCNLLYYIRALMLVSKCMLSGRDEPSAEYVIVLNDLVPVWSGGYAGR